MRAENERNDFLKQYTINIQFDEPTHAHIVYRQWLLGREPITVNRTIKTKDDC